MTLFVRINDDFHSHPKVRAAGNAAIGLWARSLSFAGCYLTDGHVPMLDALALGRRQDAAALVSAGLWIPNGDGFVIHQFLEWNPTAEEVRARRSDTAESRRAGGLARAAKAKRDENGHFV